MIEKIKKTFEALDEIENVKKALVSAKKELEDAKKNILTIEKEMHNKAASYEQENKLVLQKQHEAVESIRKLSEEFQSELNDFKTMKTLLNTEIVNQVTTDIKKELNVYVMNVKQKIDELNTASKEILKVALNSSKTLESMEKLKQISSEIKKEDFELVKYANELRRGDKEKLELMQKIDTLERLISRMRRQQH